ncbi:MAG: LytR/AlgR family response regulator transcription factor [Bryobacteraceae bacterium]
MISPALRCYLLEDEPLALKRLARLLGETGRVEIAGMSTDPVEALERFPTCGADVIFLDIEMPGMSGFEFLSKLVEQQPLVVFTTAYHHYALKAFEVNSIDYLLKPVETRHLERALKKLENMRRGLEARPEFRDLIQQLASALQTHPPEYPERLASRMGGRLEFIDLSRVTHIFAKEKLTYVSTNGRNHCVDATITELEAKLDPRKFIRIHRSTIVNVEYVHELYHWLAGRMLLRLKDEKKTELTVSRDRVSVLKTRLGV